MPVSFFYFDLYFFVLFSFPSISLFQVRFRVYPATIDGLQQALANGALILHFSGHGEPHRLYFEDAHGKTYTVDVEKFNQRNS
jgi:hypothetical protein